MLLGKFMPPHLGHVYLIVFARQYVDELFVVLGSLPTEPIPGELRLGWLRRLFPDVTVLHLDKILPQEPAEHPDFWNIWRRELKAILPAPVEFVFASEEYGQRLGAELDAEFVPVDIARSARRISGTKIRAHPFAYRDYLPACVRPYFLKRVAIVGPESSGKSTLARDLARAYDTIHVPEYARGFLERKDGRIDAGDIDRIARGQRASLAALAEQARGLLFSDTDLFTTLLWGEVFGQSPGWLRAAAREQNFDLYLLTAPDLDWVGENVRYQPESSERRTFFERLRAELERANQPYAIIRGQGAERLRTARAAVDELIGQGRADGTEQRS